MRVTEIVPSDGNRRWKIVTEDAVVTEDFDYVITTIPPRQAAEILRIDQIAPWNEALLPSNPRDVGR